MYCDKYKRECDIDFYNLDYDAAESICSDCKELNRNSYGFEISKKFYNEANEKMLGSCIQEKLIKEERTELDGQCSMFEE